MSWKTRSIAYRGARLGVYLGAGALCATAGLTGACALGWYGMRRSRQFADKVVVITGGSRGLGLAMAEEFGKRGAHLVLAARDAEELQRAVRLLVKNGAARGEETILAVPVDLRRQEDAQRLIEEATAQFGRVDILVNNAGIITVGPVENQTTEDFRQVMDTNFFAGLYCTQAVLPQMIERRSGAIANITSIGGKVAVPHLLPYTASKFAAVGFSEGLGAEVRSKGVRVTTVVPGPMRTGSARNALFSGDAEREFRWFSLSDNLPWISIGVRRAARRIVNGIASGAVEVCVTPQALIVSKAANLAPTVTRGLMQIANMLLPAAKPGTSEMRRGAELSGVEPLPSRTIGRAAARRYNQMGKMAG